MQLSQTRESANLSYSLLWWRYVDDGHVINV